MDNLTDNLEKYGKLWEKNGVKRTYINDIELAELYGLNIDCYNTGNISYAELNGRKISNSQARKLTEKIINGKFYYDWNDEQFHWSITDEIANIVISKLRV